MKYIYLFFPALVLGAAVLTAPALSADCPTGETCLVNPLKGDITDAPLVVGNVIRALLSIVGAVALVMFAKGAGDWINAAGNAEKISGGTKTMIWAAVGLLLVFASYVLLGGLIKLMTGTA